MIHENKPQDIERSLPELIDATVITTSSEFTVADRIELKSHDSLRTTLLAKIIRVMSLNILPDNIGQHTILQNMNLQVSIEMLRLIKYLICTYAMIFSAIPFIRWIVSTFVYLNSTQ